MRKLLFVAGLVLMVFLFTAAMPANTQAASPAKYYVVCPGDTLSAIAGRYGVSAWSIARANGIWNPSNIYVGQMLVIPLAGYNCYGCNYNPYQGQYYPSQYYQGQYYQGRYYQTQYYHSYGCVYWVKFGDNLSTIARRYGTDAWTVARANGIYNLNWIYSGQRLVIPGCH